MKGEIVDGAKDLVLDLDEHVDTLWKALDDGLTVEIVWEALHLIELYFALRIIWHILLTADYMLIKTRNNPLELINHEFVQLKKVTGGFFEEGKSRLWETFKMHGIPGTGINVRGKLTMNSKKNTGLYEDLILRPDRTSTHLRIPYVTETLTSSYCC